MNYQPSTINLKSPPAGETSVFQDGRREPLSCPSKLSPHSLNLQLSQPANTYSTIHTGFTSENKESNLVSHPPHSMTSTEGDTEIQDQRMNNTPSPATGQLRPESQELSDGMYYVYVWIYVHKFMYFLHWLIRNAG